MSLPEHGEMFLRQSKALKNSFTLLDGVYLRKFSFVEGRMIQIVSLTWEIFSKRRLMKRGLGF